MDYQHLSGDGHGGNGGLWGSASNMFTRIMGFSMVASLFQPVNGGVASSTGFRLFMFGTMVEVGRRFCQWVYDRFNVFQYSITAEFDEGDPVYEWIVLFLTEQKIWKRSRMFHVTATSSKRKWGIGKSMASTSNLGKGKEKETAQYVPTFEAPQLFRWRGHWAEIKRSKGQLTYNEFTGGTQTVAKLYLTIYTRDMSMLSSFVEEAENVYIKTSSPNVVIHSVDQNGYNPGFPWMNTKSKARRSLNSIILPEGVLQTILDDAREFLDTEDWYTKAGIPHRRGYLLHGPPGTGKTSTIYAMAGELGLEIYSLSLASSSVDDSFLQRAVGSIPKGAILLIEDIDCAFSSRDDDDEGDMSRQQAQFLPFPLSMGGRRGSRQSAVTLSGLLNVLDGVGSEEGRIFFATTNYIDRLDPALLRPGRIDRKVQYYLATKEQAKALFIRFYPVSHTTLLAEHTTSSLDSEKLSLPTDKKRAMIQALASEFASNFPEHEFTTAELQGYLLSCKKEPERAAAEVMNWVEEERNERKARKAREEARMIRIKERKEAREADRLQVSLDRLRERGGRVEGVGIPIETAGGAESDSPQTSISEPVDLGSASAEGDP
ncbi:P-loop containing nucleoside triphosphate hydrolase protein [Agrocybe pediades]|nr:P-loop containing nucleoside triphosphate hydrolase protein [Agrocybe pediades]